MDEPPDWWALALASDEPLVAVREWRSGEHIVMNTAALKLMLVWGGWRILF